MLCKRFQFYYSRLYLKKYTSLFLFIKFLCFSNIGLKNFSSKQLDEHKNHDNAADDDDGSDHDDDFDDWFLIKILSYIEIRPFLIFILLVYCSKQFHLKTTFKVSHHIMFFNLSYFEDVNWVKRLQND